MERLFSVASVSTVFPPPALIQQCGKLNLSPHPRRWLRFRATQPLHRRRSCHQAGERSAASPSAFNSGAITMVRLGAACLTCFAMPSTIIGQSALTISWFLAKQRCHHSSSAHEIVSAARGPLRDLTSGKLPCRAGLRPPVSNSA